MNFLERPDTDLGVNLRGVQADMPEHGLDETNIGTVLQHQRGHGVAEQMATATLTNVGFFDVFTHQLRQAVGAESFALLGQKQRAIVLTQDKMGPDVVAVFGDPGQCPFANWNHPVFFAFALANHHRAAFVVDSAPAQANQLHAAHAGAVEGFQHGPVADAGRGLGVWHIEDAFGFVTPQLLAYVQTPSRRGHPPAWRLRVVDRS